VFPQPDLKRKGREANLQRKAKEALVFPQPDLKRKGRAANLQRKAETS
jgi:ribosomal protein S21